MDLASLGVIDGDTFVLYTKTESANHIDRSSDSLSVVDSKSDVNEVKDVEVLNAEEIVINKEVLSSPAEDKNKVDNGRMDVDSPL